MYHMKPPHTDIITTVKRKSNKNVLYHGVKDRKLFDTLRYLIRYDATRLYKKMWWDLVAPSNFIGSTIVDVSRLPCTEICVSETERERRKSRAFSIHFHYDGNVIRYPVPHWFWVRVDWTDSGSCCCYYLDGFWVSWLLFLLGLPAR